MITLLIVSVALAAMAPLLSKRVQSNVNGGSDNKWVFTHNGNDITRISGNVGIGINPSGNPAAKLHVKDGKLLIENDASLSIEIVYKNDSSPIMLRNTKYNTRLAIGPNDWNNILVAYDDNENTINKVSAYMNKNGAVYQRTSSGDYLQTVPAGAIISFAWRDTCPEGWRETNGVNGTVDLRGAFIRAWDHGRGVDTGRTLYSWQDDSFKSHNHGIRWAWSASLDTGPSNVPGHYGNAGLNEYWISSTGGTETRPKNIALLMCQKI